jgi:predicted RNA methylase
MEILLIRWISTEIRIFAYLQNTVLVVCFLGLGIGCFTCRRPLIMRDLLLPFFALVLLLAIPYTRSLLAAISVFLGVLSDLVIWHQSFTESPWQTIWYVAVGLGLTLVVMLFIWEIFVPIGRLLGRLMDEHPNTIRAYSWNVAGSLVGVWLFVILSILFQPPIVWMLVVALILLFFFEATGRQKVIDLLLLCAIIGLAGLAGQQPGFSKVVWSPYQKLSLLEGGPKGVTGKYVILVNNTGYQGLLDLSGNNVVTDARVYPPDMRGFSQYDIPFLLHPKPQAALLVGAGSGNDAAGALRHGVAHVTAVEIDPAIISMGRRYHPEKPYDSSRVRVIVDDARSFFATTQQRYDVISFGLLDSHTTTAMTNARLDHYVYTRESLERAKSLLAPGGIVVLSFEATKPFIADRMARTLREVFRQEPLSFRVPPTGYGWGGVLFVTGNLEAARSRIASTPGLASLIATWQRDHPISPTYTTKILTDDWPYIYLETPRIPLLYYLLAGLLIVLLLRAVWVLQLHKVMGGWCRSHWHFFFLGAGFLLLEVQNISKASVVLGSTWLVNAVVISTVLVMVLLANALVAGIPRMSMWPVYVLLLGTCLAIYFIDLSRFAFLPYATKALLVGGMICLPMLFSGIVFIRSFADVAGKDGALGANLFGALAGGILQSVTFVTGIRALLLMVMGVYVLAMLTRPVLGEHGVA